MTNIFSFVWDVDPVAFSIGNFLSVHWLLIFSFVGLLIAFELLLYQIKHNQEEIAQFENYKKIVSNPFYFFALVVFCVIFGGKLFSLIFIYINDAHISEFSIVGGILFLLIACLIYFNKLPILIASTLDKIIFAFMIFIFSYQLGQMFEHDAWGKPTNSQNGVVFTNQAEMLLENVFDKVASVEVVDKEDKSTDEKGLPLVLHVQFIEEVSKQEDVSAFLNLEFKDALSDFGLVNSHFQNKNEEKLDFTITQLNDGKYLAHVNIDGIPRHPISIYKGLAAIVVFLVILFLKRKEVLKYVGEPSAWMVIIWFALQILLDYFFSEDFSWGLISESTIRIILIFTALCYLFNIEKVLSFKNREA